MHNKELLYHSMFHQGLREGGAGEGQWPRGPWAREGIHPNYIEKGKAHRNRKERLHVTCRSRKFCRKNRRNVGEDLSFFFWDPWFWPKKQSKFRWRPFFFFWSLDFGRKNSRSFGEDLFFWRSHHFLDQTAAFSPSILDFTKPEFHHIWAGPGPTFGSLHPCVPLPTIFTGLFWRVANFLRYVLYVELQAWASARGGGGGSREGPCPPGFSHTLS